MQTRSFALLWGSLLAVGASAAAGLPGMVFNEGLYGHDGHCAELRRPVGGERQACKDRFGVLVRSQHQVSFMFDTAEGDGSVIFRASSPPEYRNDNDLAVYRIDNVLDMTSKQVYVCPGECSVESRRDGVAVECTAWKKTDRKDTCASARFLGNGMWMFQPAGISAAPSG